MLSAEKKIALGFMEFSDTEYRSCINSQGGATAKLDFKVTIVFNVKYPENGTR